MVLHNKNLEKKLQKNRFKTNPKKLKNIFGDVGLFCKNEGKLELIHISLIKKKIKQFIRKKKSENDVIREKIWYFGRFNFYIQKKSKNSRMGKGKGALERKIMRVRRNFIIFEFLGVPLIKIKKLIKYLNKFLNVKLFILSKYNINFSLWSKKFFFFNYHEKYLV